MSGGGGCPFQANKSGESEGDTSSSDGEGGGDNQMMLASDMVLVWDAGGSKYSKVVYRLSADTGGLT